MTGPTPIAIVGAADRDFFFGFSASAPKPLPRRGARTGRRRGAVKAAAAATRRPRRARRAIMLVQMRDASLPCRCAVLSVRYGALGIKPLESSIETLRRAV